MDNEWKTIRVKCLRPVYERQVIRENAPAYLKDHRIRRAEDVYELMYDLQLEGKEHFICLHMDSQHKIICIDRVSTGSLNQSIVHPSDVFKGALLSSAAGLILVHNHPSGNAEPSSEDVAVTKRLQQAGDLIGIKVLDHVIVGEHRFTSLAERGLI